MRSFLKWFVAPMLIIGCFAADSLACGRGLARRVVAAEFRLATAPLRLLHRERSSFREVTRVHTRTVAVGGYAAGACAMPAPPPAVVPAPEPKKDEKKKK